MLFTLPPPSVWCDRWTTARAVARRWSLPQGAGEVVDGTVLPGRCTSSSRDQFRPRRAVPGRAAMSTVRVVVPSARAVRPVAAAAQTTRTHALVLVQRPEHDGGEQQ